jgi:F0F1-type ATP synthase membrane subunit b/b'
MIRPQGAISTPSTGKICSSAISMNKIAATLAATVLFAIDAFASGAEGAHHGSITDTVGPWINFIVYIALLSVLVRKPLKAGWAARRQRIAEEVSAATSEMESAERSLATVEALTKNISQEQERARAEILKQGELEAASIASAAREKASRIKSQVQDLLEGESRSAQANFRAALVAKAVELSKARFESGEFSSRQGAYVEAAVDRAKKLVR